MASTDKGRRQFLAGLSAGLTTFAAVGRAASAQSQAEGKAGAVSLKVIDFHSHYVGPAFTSIAGAAAPAAQRARWQQVNSNLSDPQALVSSIEAAGIAGRVVNTPLEFIQDAGADVAPGMVERINDELAELISRHPGRLYGLATVDAFSGDAGARELNRAVRDLGLRGVFVQAAKNDLLLDAPQARPTLTAAAGLGVPVFVHPIFDPHLGERFARYGRHGTTCSAAPSIQRP